MKGKLNKKEIFKIFYSILPKRSIVFIVHLLDK